MSQILHKKSTIHFSKTKKKRGVFRVDTAEALVSVAASALEVTGPNLGPKGSPPLFGQALAQGFPANFIWQLSWWRSTLISHGFFERFSKLLSKKSLETDNPPKGFHLFMIKVSQKKNTVSALLPWGRHIGIFPIFFGGVNFQQVHPGKLTCPLKKGTISIGNTSSNHQFSGRPCSFWGVYDFSKKNGSDFSIAEIHP